MNTTPITAAERLVDDLWRAATVSIDSQTTRAADACFLALGLAALAGS